MQYGDLPMNGDALRARIYECGYNMSTFAKAMDVTPSAVHKWVASGYPTGKHLARVLELLHSDLRPADDNERLAAIEGTISRLLETIVQLVERVDRLADRLPDADRDAPATRPARSSRRSN